MKELVSGWQLDIPWRWFSLLLMGCMIFLLLACQETAVELKTSPTSLPTALAVPGAPPVLESLPQQADAAVDPAGILECLEGAIHPIGKRAAESYEVPYEKVMNWYCQGIPFEDILLALETGVQAGIPAETVLQRLQNGLTWDEIWQELGIYK